MEVTYDKIRADFKSNLHENKYSREIIPSDKTVKDNEHKANSKFENLLSLTRNKIGEEFHFHPRKFVSYIKHEENALWNLIKKMPKGALHHSHITVHCSAKYLTELAVTEERAFINLQENTLAFYSKADMKKEIPENFINLQNALERKLVTKEELYTYFTMDTKKEEIWLQFERKIMNGSAILMNSKNYKNYLIQIFNDSLDEGLLIYQGRSFLGWIKDYNSEENTNISVEAELEMILEAREEVRKREPLFEVNIIRQGLRWFPKSEIEALLNETIALKLLKKEYEDIIIGFDLVGHEDLKESTHFAETLFIFMEKNKKANPNMNFQLFLHAGESCDVENDNIVDNLILNTPRIGHGINLAQNIHLLEVVKKANICLELNPLSNNVLLYIHDLRQHPLKTFLNHGVKVSISSDDDGLFGTESIISYDFFIAGISMKFNLWDFKQVCYNSIICSAMHEEKIKATLSEWNIQWNNFIKNILDNY